MKKGIILLKDHFEDVEALITIDILRRAGITVEMVSLNDTLELTTQSNIVMYAEKLYEDININDYDFVVLPGGRAVKEYHLNSTLTKQILKSFYEANKLVACICAAPGVLGELGLLSDNNYTIYPGCEKDSYGLSKNTSVVRYNNIITSKACGTTFDFALEIVKYLTSEENAKKVKKSIYYKED